MFLRPVCARGKFFITFWWLGLPNKTTFRGDEQRSTMSSRKRHIQLYLESFKCYDQKKLLYVIPDRWRSLWEFWSWGVHLKPWSIEAMKSGQVFNLFRWVTACFLRRVCCTCPTARGTDEDVSTRSFTREPSGQWEDMASYWLTQGEGFARFYVSSPRDAIPVTYQEGITHKLCV